MLETGTKHLRSISLFLLSMHILAILLTAQGCAPIPPVCQEIDAETGRLLDLIRQNNAQIETLRGQGRLEIIDNGKKESFRAVWIGSLPGRRFRFDILSPWGQPVATLGFGGEKLFFYVYAKDRLYEKDATASDLARFIHVKIEPEELLNVLAGSVPIACFSQARIQSETGGKALLVLIKRAKIIQKVWIRLDPLTILRSDYFDGGKDLTYSIVFDNFEYRKSMVIPNRITISARDDVQWVLAIRRYETNPPVFQENFELKPVQP
jgi:hypothetical protein